jgi:hypothetical protein
MKCLVRYVDKVSASFLMDWGKTWHTYFGIVFSFYLVKYSLYLRAFQIKILLRKIVKLTFLFSRNVKECLLMCNTPYVTYSLTRRWVCLLWICLAGTLRTYRMLFKILPFALHKSSVSTGFTKQIMPVLSIWCYNGSLVTWTVVSLTTVKFKPLISILLADSLYSRGTDHILNFFYYCRDVLPCNCLRNGGF